MGGGEGGRRFYARARCRVMRFRQALMTSQCRHTGHDARRTRRRRDGAIAGLSYMRIAMTFGALIYRADYRRSRPHELLLPAMARAIINTQASGGRAPRRIKISTATSSSYLGFSGTGSRHERRPGRRVSLRFVIFTLPCSFIFDAIAADIVETLSRHCRIESMSARAPTLMYAGRVTRRAILVGGVVSSYSGRMMRVAECSPPRPQVSRARRWTCRPYRSATSLIIRYTAGREAARLRPPTRAAWLRSASR